MHAPMTTVLVLLCAWLAVLEAVQICQREIPNCNGDSCTKSAECYHGDCGEAGRCECDLCWKGNTCNEYVDTFLPEFNREEALASVSDPWSPEAVFTALALDGDLGTTCPGEDAALCDCAEPRYSIADGDPDRLFHVDALSGDVYVREASKVVSGRTYNLTLEARSARGEISESPNSRMILRVVIDDIHHHLSKVMQQNALEWLDFDEEPLSRQKRSSDKAENDNYLTEFNFTLLSGELETMEAGHRLDYRLEILVPKTDGMQLTVELFTKDVGNGNYTPVLALFNVGVDTAQGLALPKGKPHIEMLLSDQVMTAYDRAIITFGEVKNSNADPIPLTLVFSATQIKNQGTAYDTKYLVTAGAEYDKETYVWVGQSEVTVHNSTDEKSLSVKLLGPEEIPLDEAGVYVLQAHCAVRSDNFTVEVSVSDATDLLTIGNLGVKDFDVNYDPVPQNIYFYNTTKEGSDDDVIYSSARLDLGIMTNIGSYDKPEDPGNVINVTFALFALNNASNVGKTVSFVTKIVVGRTELDVQEHSVKLVPRRDHKQTVTAQVTLSDKTLKQGEMGDMVLHRLWSNLTNNGFADYVVEVGVMEASGVPVMEACSARLWAYPGSFNVPFLNTTFVDPEIVGGKYLFRFSRIHVTGQRTPSIYNDSMVFVDVAMKVSNMTFNKPKPDGSTVSRDTQVKVGTQGTPQTQVDVSKIEIVPLTNKETPNTIVENGAEWAYLYGGGAIVLNLTTELLPGMGYSGVMVEAKGENAPPLPLVHVCRAELSEVGRNIPCLRMHQQEVNEKSTAYGKTDPKNKLPDVTSVYLGDVAALPVAGGNFTRVSIVVELPEGSVYKENEMYPIDTGVLVASNLVSMHLVNYTMKKGPPPDLQQYQHPEAHAVYDDKLKVIPGHLAEVEIWLDTRVQTISAVTVEVEGSTRDVSLCGLKVKSFGRNLPCIDPHTEPYYLPHDNPLDGNRVAGLKFSALSNVGFRADPAHDRLVALALVRIGPSCRKPSTELQWRVSFGGGNLTGVVPINVDLEADTSDMSVSAKPPRALAFKPAYPGKSIAAGSPIVVDVEVSLEPGSLAPVLVQVENSESGKRHPYDMCLGGVWFRGRNYPCFSPVQVESNFSSSGGNRNDSAVYNLGLVCNTFVDNREEENKVTIRVAMRPVDEGLKIKDPINLKGFATVGSTRKEMDPVKFTIAREPEQIETQVAATVKAVNDEPLPIRVHQRLWIPFNVTIPVDSVVKVTAEARAQVADGRAIMTVHGLRLVSGGVNIPCPHLYPQPVVTLNRTTPTTQVDIVKAQVGYFTNLGLSHKMNMAQMGDDDLTLEVEVEMADHPLADHERLFDLTFVAEVGSVRAEAKQPMRVERDGNERADLAVIIHVDARKTYQSGDRINVTVSVVHKRESTAEPVNATVRLYLPPYVEFEGKVFDNATTLSPVDFVTEFGGLDIVLTQFLFSDSAVLVLSLLADPRNERGFGRGEVNATTPWRVLCRQHYKEAPEPNPPSPDTIVSCGPLDYISYVVNSQECEKNLGLYSPKKIYKCQVSASSAAKRETGPYNIRTGGKKGWSPALRLGPHKPFFQVDFLRTTRVSKLEFFKVDDTRPVTKYRLQYSHTGSDWLYANEITELTYKGNKATDKLSKPVQTRFVRVVVEEADRLDEDKLYVGLKMEMYGCYIGEKALAVTCAKHDPTWYSDDKNKYGRHFTVDLGRDIMYFCDLEYDMENLVCFASTDAGNSWRILPRSFGGLLGWDKKSSKTLGFDARRRAYVASEDGGQRWTAVSDAEVNATLIRKTFQRAQPVPAFTAGDIDELDTQTGRWRATFDGLMYEGRMDPKARWSRCCKLGK